MIGRREFITLFGGVAACGARAAAGDAAHWRAHEFSLKR